MLLLGPEGHRNVRGRDKEEDFSAGATEGRRDHGLGLGLQWGARDAKQ